MSPLASPRENGYTDDEITMKSSPASIGNNNMEIEEESSKENTPLKPKNEENNNNKMEVKEELDKTENPPEIISQSIELKTLTGKEDGSELLMCEDSNNNTMTTTTTVTSTKSKTLYKVDENGNEYFDVYIYIYNIIN